MKYDDASWHYNGEFPEGLAEEAGATHIGMFVAWALLNGLGGTLHTEEFPEELEALRDRETTPGRFLIDVCDEKFTDEDLSDEGNAFAEVYYNSKNAFYLTDYESTFSAAHTTLHHVEDSWVNFDKISKAIDRRFEEWRRGNLQDSPQTDSGGSTEVKRPWWKFW